MERAVVHGVHVSSRSARITVTGVPGGAVAAVVLAAAERGAPVGLVCGRTALTFTVADAAGPAVLAALRAARARLGFHRVDLEEAVAVLTMTGTGLRADPAIPATFCEVVARNGIRLDAVSIENSRLSVVCGAHQREAAVRALCEAFEVGTPALVARTAHPT